MFFNKIHMGGSIILEIESSILLPRIHDTHLILHSASPVPVLCSGSNDENFATRPLSTRHHFLPIEKW